MSIDISLYLPVNTGKDVIEWCCFDTNMTHNLAGMWRKAGCYDALYMSDGLRADRVTDAIREAVARMEASPITYEALNAENGWGTYEQALPWLRSVLAAFEEYPAAIIHVSK